MDERRTLELLERLLNALGEELPADQAIAPVSGDGPYLVELEVASQPVKLLCNPALEPAVMTVVCPLGPIPDGGAQAEAVLRQLLRVSHLAAGSGTSVGYEPEDRCLHLLHVVPLATASARLLVATMAGLARLARRWRDDHFLGAPPPFPAGELTPSARA